MSTIQIAGYKKHSFVDGPGVRFALFMQGCPHACRGCHNPATWSREAGLFVDTDEIIRQMEQTKYLDGITISGGEPLLQPVPVKEIAEAAHRMGLDVWLYTGWTYEQILTGAAGEAVAKVLEDVDVLVDGPFIAARAYRRDEAYGGNRPVYCGSSNQRVIDVAESRRMRRCVLYPLPDAGDMKIAN